MYLVSVDRLQPGMRLGMTVRTMGGLVLLRAGVELSADYIRHLKRLEVPAVYIENPLAPDVGPPPDPVRLETRMQLGAGLHQANEQIRRVLATTGEQQQRRWSFNHPALRDGVSAVVAELMQNRNAMIHLRDVRAADEYTLGHSVNVCVLSVLLGISLGWPEGALRELALGALLHDVGKSLVAPEILRKEGKLTDAEMAEMRTHTTRGYEILCCNPEISHLVALIALQHHERWLGGGYPKGIRGKEITIQSRVVAIADVYDAMVSDRVYRAGMPPWRALQIMLGESRGFFEPRLLDIFVTHIAPYPIGSLVSLTDGSIGVVTDARRGYGYRPTVRVVKGPDDRLVAEPYTVNLARSPDLAVAEVLIDQGGQGTPRPEEIEELAM